MSELFRISFSVLDPWSKGNYDEAMRRYLKIPTPPTKQMEDGSLLHRSWQTETIETKALPTVFGGKALDHGETELKITCVIDGWIEFVGIIDCIETDIIHEYKTGASNSMYWARTMQTKCYQVLTTLNGFNPKQAIIHHFNQYTNQTTTSKLYLSKKTYSQAEEWIRTFSSEMREAIENSKEFYDGNRS